MEENSVILVKADFNLKGSIYSAEVVTTEAEFNLIHFNNGVRYKKRALEHLNIKVSENVLNGIKFV